MLGKTAATLYRRCRRGHFSHFEAKSIYTSFPTLILSKSNKTSKKSTKLIAYWNSQITQHGRTGNIKESESIFNRMHDKTTVSYTAMLTAYAQNGQISHARKLFDGMPERTTASYNAMITAYIKSNCMVDEAFSLFSQMGERNEVSYATMIMGFQRAGIFDKAERLYRAMPAGWRDPVCSNGMITGYLKAGRLDDAVRVFESMVERDVVSWTAMIDGYCKKGRIVEARGLFDRMVDRNVVTWTAMIDGYMKIGCFDEGAGLFLSMRREGVVAVNPTTFTIMFEACGHLGKLREGTQLHGLVLRLGFEFDVFLGNSIITMYCRFGCLDEANRIFNLMSKKDIVTWNSLIDGYVQHNQMEEANKLFVKIPRKDVVSWTTMIAGFSGKGDFGKSIQLFKLMPEKDGIAWTVLISGFVTNELYEEAFRWYIEMLRDAVRPNSHTLSSMISASAGLATLNQGLQIHCHVIKMDMACELSIENSLVSMYSKCGNVAEAYQIFTNIEVPNVVSFNSMITGFSQNGDAEEAFRLFRLMHIYSCKPNEITFLGVLSACAHAGIVTDGWEYFKSMKFLHDIEPGPDHYACMVDLLGRAGLLDYAFALINSMPFEGHSGVWGALLGSSRTHFRLDLAKIAVDHLTKLEPDNATPYVVLSDLYNIAGKVEDGNLIRVTKKLKGIRKTPGCSWISSE